MHYFVFIFTTSYILLCLCFINSLSPHSRNKESRDFVSVTTLFSVLKRVVSTEKMLKYLLKNVICANITIWKVIPHIVQYFHICEKPTDMHRIDSYQMQKNMISTWHNVLFLIFSDMNMNICYIIFITFFRYLVSILIIKSADQEPDQLGLNSVSAILKLCDLRSCT